MKKLATNCSDTLYKALEKAIETKGKKVQDNNAALFTEALSDIQVASEVGSIAFKIAFQIAPEPASKAIVSALMLLSATPVIWSLIAEIKKDRKDYAILKAIKAGYDSTGDPEILKNTRLCVKLHSTPQESADPPLNIHDVQLIYNKIPDSILTLVNEAKASTAKDSTEQKASLREHSKFILTTIFNAFALATKSCTVEAGQTARTIAIALKDVKGLLTRDFRHIWQQARGQTLLESKRKVLLGLKGSPHVESQEVNSLLAPHMKLAESLHPLQDDLRTNARMRIGTATGILACSSFALLALTNASIAMTAGSLGAAYSYIGLSFFLSIPPLRILCERQHELARINEDKTIQVIERLRPQ